VRRRLVLGATAAVALAVPGTALAHVTLVDSEPVTQSRVDRPPTEVRLRFNEPVTITSNAVEVLAPNGTLLLVEPFANDKTEDNMNPVGRLFYCASTMI